MPREDLEDAELDVINIERVDVWDAPGDEVLFDVVVSAKFTISAHWHADVETYEKSE